MKYFLAKWWQRSLCLLNLLLQRLKRILARGAGAMLFYTCVPLPSWWPVVFERIAAYAPVMGLLIGGWLAGVELALAWVQMPILTRSALVVALWVGITGGLHLDGAMDTADGLGVSDPQRRLTVMADSRTGAFGAIAAVVILGLKVAALADITQHRWLMLLLAPAWGRWAQVVAIARYPYLKPAGKGAFHKAEMVLPNDFLPGSLGLIALGVVAGWLVMDWWAVLVIWVMGAGLAIALAAWFNHLFGGHTGDTYGAVVEWTEALLLCGLTLLATGTNPGWAGFG
jgi:adenosylcobinamide-GDP ribazoletransferase